MDLREEVLKLKEKNYITFLENNQSVLEFLNEKLLDAAEAGKVSYEIPMDTIENAHLYKRYYEELGFNCEITLMDFDAMMLYELKVHL